MVTAYFPACFDQLDDIRAFVNLVTKEAGMDEAGRCAVEMATDEACSNIIEHAYQASNLGEIKCECEFDENTFTVILHDHGKPFDINMVPAPDLENSLDRRRIGGLGVFLIRELMDEVRYEKNGELGNMLTLKRRITSEK